MMRIRATRKAERQLASRREWWRQNRPEAPDLFDQEFAALVDRFVHAPESFLQFVERRGRIVRRGLMPKTRCHLYIEVRPVEGEVVIVAAGGGQQQRPPRFRLQEGQEASPWSLLRGRRAGPEEKEVAGTRHGGLLWKKNAPDGDRLHPMARGGFVECDSSHRRTVRAPVGPPRFVTQCFPDIPLPLGMGVIPFPGPWPRPHPRSRTTTAQTPGCGTTPRRRSGDGWRRATVNQATSTSATAGARPDGRSRSRWQWPPC